MRHQRGLPVSQRLDTGRAGCRTRAGDRFCLRRRPSGRQRLAEAEQVGAEMAAALGARTADELRALAPDAIEGPRGFWGPIIDGDVLREPVHAVFERGDQIDVPVLAGYTRDEAAPYPTPEL